MGFMAGLMDAKGTGTADRTKMLGASEVAAVLGLSPWATPLDVWLRKTAPLDADAAAHHERGHFLEDAVVRWTASRLGATEVEGGVRIDEPFLGLPAFPNVGMHPDAAVLLPSGWHVVEAKTSRDAASWGAEDNEAVPEHILVQTAVQSAIADVPVVVGAYLPIKDELRVYRLDRNRQLEADVMELAQAWWDRHVVGNVMPDLTGGEGVKRHLAAKFGPTLRPAFDADDELTMLLRCYLDAREQAKAADANAEALANALRVRVGDAEGFTSPAGKVTWKWQQGASRVDAKRLRAMFPEAAIACTVQGDPSRVLRVTPAKGGSDE